MNAQPITLSLEFQDEVTWVRSMPGLELSIELSMPVGVGALARNVLRHAPPSPLEIEQAIELVEEAVMPARVRLPAALQLFSADQLLYGLASEFLGEGHRTIAAQHPSGLNLSGPWGSPIWLSMDAVEALFNRLIARSEGRPEAQDRLPVDSAHSARLIMVRELLHHWALSGLNSAA
ncbi:hypothetical protein [Ottowia thiooxydans]|uniref:hypothetical protein n=1 Tax=Ottowia thiooxydans TaxID=219182 RepID=UPI003392EDB3